MKMNFVFCKTDDGGMLRYAPFALNYNGMVMVNPPAEVYAALGWYAKTATPPDPVEGKVWEEDEPSAWAWDAATMTVRVTYHAEDVPAPEPMPRRWTPLTLKRGAVTRGWWDALKGILENANGYEDFLMCQFVAEDDAMFAPIYAVLCDAFGEDAVKSYLDELPTEA